MFSRNIKGRYILFLFIITMTVYLVMLTVTIPKLMEFSDGRKIMDMMPGGYDVAYVTDLMDSLSEEGRGFYLTKQLPLDFVYPGLFAVSYAMIFMFFLRKINKHESNWRYAAFLPVIAGIADYIENICIISMLKTFPDVSDRVVNFASTVSVLKASATTIYFVLLIILLLIVGVNALKRPGNPTHESR